jgi:hypothetical protein
LSRTRIRKYALLYNRPDVAGFIFTPQSELGKEPLVRLPVFFDFLADGQIHHVQIAASINSFRDKLGLQVEFNLQLAKFEPGFRKAFRKILPDLFLTYGTIRGSTIRTEGVVVLYFPIFSFTLTESNPYALD